MRLEDNRVRQHDVIFTAIRNIDNSLVDNTAMGHFLGLPTIGACVCYIVFSALDAHVHNSVLYAIGTHARYGVLSVPDNRVGYSALSVLDARVRYSMFSSSVVHPCPLRRDICFGHPCMYGYGCTEQSIDLLSMKYPMSGLGGD